MMIYESEWFYLGATATLVIVFLFLRYISYRRKSIRIGMISNLVAAAMLVAIWQISLHNYWDDNYSASLKRLSAMVAITTVFDIYMFARRKREQRRE